MIYNTHLLNFIAEKVAGQLDIGSLRRFFEHLQDDSSCYYCSPERAKQDTANLGRCITRKHQIGGSTLTKYKTAIKRFLESYDPNLAQQFLKRTWVKRIKPPRREPFRARLRELDFERLLKEKVFDNLHLSDGTFIPARRLALWLQFQFALGFSELASLRVQNIDLDARIIQISRQKTKAQFPVVIYTQTQAHRLARFIDLRKQVLQEWNIDFPELLFRYSFWHNRGDYVKPWSYEAYRRLVKLLFKGTQFDRSGFSTHELRRWGASHLLYDKGWQLRDVQRHLGHESPSTTAAYCQMDVVEFRERVLSQ